LNDFIAANQNPIIDSRRLYEEFLTFSPGCGKYASLETLRGWVLSTQHLVPKLDNRPRWN